MLLRQWQSQKENFLGSREISDEIYIDLCRERRGLETSLATPSMPSQALTDNLLATSVVSEEMKQTQTQIKQKQEACRVYEQQRKELAAQIEALEVKKEKIINHLQKPLEVLRSKIVAEHNRYGVVTDTLLSSEECESFQEQVVGGLAKDLMRLRGSGLTIDHLIKKLLS